MKRYRAFTLIEILVVISVIALLVSILLPSVTRAKELAQQTLCATRIRALGAAIHFYTDESNDVLPSTEPRNREPVSPLHWFMNEHLMKHVDVAMQHDEGGNLTGPGHRQTALICPSHADPAMSRPTESEPSVPLAYSLSYGMNGTFGLGGRPDQTNYRRYDEFQNPSDVLALADCWGIPTGPGIVLYHACVKDNLVYRHLEKTNVVFLDTHVESLTEEHVPMGFGHRYEPFWSARKP